MSSNTKYLDDPDVKENSEVICVHNIGCPDFTLGKTYKVLKQKKLFDDKGFKVFPSARFKKAL